VLVEEAHRALVVRPETEGEFLVADGAAVAQVEGPGGGDPQAFARRAGPCAHDEDCPKQGRESRAGRGPRTRGQPIPFVDVPVARDPHAGGQPGQQDREPHKPGGGSIGQRGAVGGRFGRVAARPSRQNLRAKRRRACLGISRLTQPVDGLRPRAFDAFGLNRRKGARRWRA
jgi:hypothetical protein